MKELICNDTFFGILLTIISFNVGVLINKKTNMVIFNPLLIAIILIITILLLFDIEYDTYYKGGEIFQKLLTPVTVAFAVPLYRQMDVVKKYYKEIGVSVIIGCFTCLISILVLSKVINISDDIFYGIMPKSVTLAIALGIAEKFGGLSAVTCIGVVFSGIIGAAFGKTIANIFGIKNKVALGLSVGTASHAIGTARFMEQDELVGAIGSIAIVIAGITTVFMATIIQMFF